MNSEALVHFRDLKNLKSLALYGCRGMEEINNDMLDRLENGLPNLKCVRLNNGSADDGAISTRREESDDEDFDSDTDEMTFDDNIHRTAVMATFQDAVERDNHSGVDDPNGREFDSDSSYSSGAYYRNMN